MTYSSIKKYLDQPVDNTPLIIFRIAFGLLIVFESFGAILLGWVKRVFIDPEFNFTFIGLEWLQPLPGIGMYLYFWLMGVLGLFIMLGFHYRKSMGLFTLMWWGVYLMQKSSYNNHYYLLILLCFMMWLVPAHHNASIDVRQNRVFPAITCPRWCIDIFKWQLLIVFTYAAFAKIYPGWISGEFISQSFGGKADYPVIGPLLQQNWFQQLVIFGGIAYDLTIIPLMYLSATRRFGLIVSIAFHLFNSVVFGIGIFPYLMIASMVLFFPVKNWQTKIPGYQTQGQAQNQNLLKNLLYPILTVYFLWQLWLPVRHYFIPGDVFITEEGHRMAWRMMLRSKYGWASFKVVNKTNGESWVVYPKEYLTEKQSFKMGGRPDMIWQFTRFLARKYSEQGINDLEIYVNSNAYLNQTRISPLIDPKVDMLSVEWKRFGHNEWIIGKIDN